ncbi:MULTISPECIES: BatD family protein [unclassified Flavobacterium]|uniref:BatD family protein n=1 Tax=unclassified Flavobacterium TaxID=196869 RepID=UPI001F146284|nr:MULTISPECIES: BatD family protein [unclassified Flavobacterium]UMY66501.1 BatD family protein [Flavobacterium sp. HJ-32-4]
MTSKLKSILAGWALLMVGTLSAQKVTTHIDTTRHKIGAQFNLTLTATADTMAKVVFPHGRAFGPLEVIRNYKTDTIRKGGNYDLVRKYGLTQFDSGKFTIPPLKVTINGKPYFSDSVRLEVGGVKVDTLQQKMYDIKPIIEAPSDWRRWLWIIVALALLLVLGGVGVGVYYLIKKRQKTKLGQAVYKSPIEKATALLQQLDQKALWQKGEVKDYYSELTNIARTYIEEEINVPAMESTTSEVIDSLRREARRKNMKLTPETLENLEKVLRQADLVKFAKSKPIDFEIEDDKKRIEKTILQIHKAVPVAVIEEGESELSRMMRERALKKKKQRRILIGVGASVGVLMLSLIILLFIKGPEFIKDKVLGHPTRELWEGEWVSSEYGNPPVYIETPRILKRLDLAQTMPKEGMATLREMQTFAYGSVLDEFSIVVSTRKEKQAVTFDADKVLENTVTYLQTAGKAQNIVVKKEAFSTKSGIDGTHGFGTFDHVNPLTGKKSKLCYEVFLFTQEGGLQQVFVQYGEGDEYGKKIFERVMKSIELKVLPKS